MKTPTTKFLKEASVARALAKKEIKLEEATKILQEGGDYKFSKGEKVYVAFGIHGGSYGNFLGETNGGYGEIDLHAAGVTKIVPLWCLQKSLNKGAP